MANINCPFCNYVLLEQPTTAVNYRLLLCHNYVESKLCPFEGFINVETGSMFFDEKLRPKPKEGRKTKVKKESGWKTIDERLNKES